MNQIKTSQYKNIPHFALMVALTAFGLAFSLSIVITVLLFGLNIVKNGVNQCALGLQAGMWDIFLHSPCSCATFLIIIFFPSAWGIWFTVPRFLRQRAHLTKLIQERRKK